MKMFTTKKDSIQILEVQQSMTEQVLFAAQIPQETNFGTASSKEYFMTSKMAASQLQKRKRLKLSMLRNQSPTLKSQ